MNKESLVLLRDIITDTIIDLPNDKINEIDKFETLRNLRELLSPENYDEDIKILTKQNDKRRFL